MSEKIQLNSETILHVMNELQTVQANYRNALDAMEKLSNNRYFASELTDIPFESYEQAYINTASLYTPLTNVTTAISSSLEAMIQTDATLHTEFEQLEQLLGKS